MNISGSLVLYKNKYEIFEAAILSFLQSCDGILCVVDNSPEPLQSYLFTNERVVYIHSYKNIGFGAAHNLAFDKVSYFSDFHLILNPDIFFEKEVIPILYQVMRRFSDIGVIMPRVNYANGELQRVCKLMPTPLDLLVRRFSPSKRLSYFFNKRYELFNLPQTDLIDVPMISGCFMFVRTEIFKYLKGFDEQFFMYLEDFDLIRRIGDISRVVYYPLISIKHAYAKGSYNNYLLLIHHIKSAFLYFNKWGWFFDNTRKYRNINFLNKLKAQI